MAIETYYFKNYTTAANVDEIVTYLNRYSSDLSYNVTKTATVNDNDVPITQCISIYNKKDTVIDSLPLVSIHLGGTDHTVTTGSISVEKFIRWKGRSGSAVSTDVFGSTTTTAASNAILLDNLLASVAYKTSNGIMILFNVNGHPLMRHSMCIAKNSIGRLALSMIPITGIWNASTSVYGDAHTTPVFVGDSKEGGFQYFATKNTQDGLQGSVDSELMLSRVVYPSYTMKAGRTVLVPMVSKSEVYSPYMYLRFFSETPESVGIMECDGVQYATDGLFALKE